MPYSFSDSTERAITVRLQGQDLVLRSLNIFDLIPWLETETQFWRERELKKIPDDAKDRPARVDYINSVELNPPALKSTMFKPAGAVSAVHRLFEKAGKSPDDAKAWLSAANPPEVIVLAVTLSGLFTRQEVDTLFNDSTPPAEKNNPNAQTDQPS